MTLGSWILRRIMVQRYLDWYYDWAIKEQIRHREYWRAEERKWFDAETRD